MPRRKGKRESSADEFYFDAEEAERWVDWFELFLTHVTGHLQGQSIVLEEWQKEELIRPLFGWRRKDDKTRKYRTAFVFLPRKNTKSTIIAGIGLGMTIIDGEAGARNFASAATEDQAHELFDIAKGMIRQNPELDAICEVLEDVIQHRETGNTFRCISGSSKGKTGFHVHFAAIDEYHEQPNLKIRQVLKTGTVGRRQPLMVMLTTAGDDKNSVCYREYQYAKKVRDGVIKNDSYFALIYEADEEDDPHDERTWKAANPGYGTSINPRTFREIHDEAQKSAGEWNTFLQFHLNRWVHSRARYLPLEKWEACQRDFSVEDLKGLVCYGGLDLASIRDLCSLTLVFPEWARAVGEDILRPSYRVLNWNWIPEEGAAQRENEGYPYLDWIRNGWIKATPGDVTDYEIIRQDINEIGTWFKLSEIGYDPFKATEIVQKLQDEDGFKMTVTRTGTRTMSPAVDRWEHLVLRQELTHNGNGVLTFAVSNAVAKIDSKKNKMIDKEREEEKIDPLVAGIIAMARAMVAPAPAPEPYVEVWDW